MLATTIAMLVMMVTAMPDAVGKTLKRATPMATMVRWPKVFRTSPELFSSGQ